jgi:hypothetical protein
VPGGHDSEQEYSLPLVLALDWQGWQTPNVSTNSDDLHFSGHIPFVSQIKFLTYFQ